MSKRTILEITAAVVVIIVFALCMYWADSQMKIFQFQRDQNDATASMLLEEAAKLQCKLKLEIAKTLKLERKLQDIKYAEETGVIVVEVENLRKENKELKERIDRLSENIIKVADLNP